MDTPEPRVTVHDEPPPALAEAVDAGLDAHNLAHAPLATDVRPLAVGATEGGALLGGAIGRTWGRCAELQQLWVQPSQRRRGLGARLVRAFEEAAAARGAALVYLDTFSFQARPFYEQQGYRVVLTLEGYTQGIARFTMQKDL